MRNEKLWIERFQANDISVETSIRELDYTAERDALGPPSNDFDAGRQLNSV